MAKPNSRSEVVTLRVPRAIGRRLTREARRQRRTRGAVARDLLIAGLEGPSDEDLLAEARRQSRLVSKRASERGVLRFITATADLRGWE